MIEVIDLAISLQKGQRVDLTKGNPGLSKIMVGLGWDPVDNRGGKEVFLVHCLVAEVRLQMLTVTRLFCS